MQNLVSWVDVLALLDVRAQPCALPTRTTCPSCKQATLDVLYDPVYAAPWYVCQPCHFAGDSLELVAAIKTEGALSKAYWLLQSRGLVNENESKALSYAEARLRANRFWDLAGRTVSVPDEPLFADTAAAMGVDPSQLGSPEWLTRGGRFVRCATRAQFEQNFSAKSVSYDIKHRGWNTVLVIPFYDLPGRICAFCFTGDVLYGAERVWHCVLPVPVTAQPVGIAMLDAVDSRPVVVAQRLHVALRHQLKHLRDHLQPLPFVVVHAAAGSKVKSIRAALGARRLVYWGVANFRFFSHAVVDDSEIAELAPEIPVDELVPTAVYHALIQSAQPWQRFIERRISALSLPSAAQYLKEIGLDERPKLMQFIAGCADKDRLAELLEVDDYQTVDAGEYKVLQRPDGWYRLTRTGKTKITDTPYSIERVIHKPEQAEHCLEGHFLHGGTRYEFTAPKDAFEADPFRWLETFMVCAKIGLPIYSQRYSRDSVMIARLFHQPEIVHVEDAVGWNERLSGFTFPRYIQYTSGETQPASPDNLLPGSTLRNVPCLSFRAPLLPLERKAITALSRNTLNVLSGRIIWDVVAHVVTTALDHWMGDLPAKLALVGGQARDVGILAALACGCARFQRVHTETFQSWLRTTHRAIAQHHWPALLVCKDAAGLVSFGMEASLQFEPGVIVPVVESVAKRLGTLGNWRLIISHGHEAAAEAMLAALPEIVPYYLKNLCERQLKLPAYSSRYQAVRTDLRHWWLARGGVPWEASAWQCTVDGDTPFLGWRAETVIHGLYRLPREDTTTLRHENKQAVYLIDDHAFVTEGIFDDVCAAAFGAVDNATTEYMKVRKLLMPRKNYYGRNGYELSAEWFTERVTSSRRPEEAR